MVGAQVFNHYILSAKEKHDKKEKNSFTAHHFQQFKYQTVLPASRGHRPDKDMQGKR
jgi:hypothetical protein